MPIAPGIKLGQYEVQDFIGQGAMGLVYRAYHPQLERKGAVKVLQAITPDADTVARFRHEAQAIAQLRHPNIVEVYDFGEFQGSPYMIVEYVPGGSLAAKMGEGPLEGAVAVRYLRGIAAGLDYAHSHGIVHRDVKPANVLLTADDTPVLADFGLAKLLQGNSLKSMTGVTTGTPAYMAPEQVVGGKVTPAVDRYSLATIAYEMLTGVIPFDGEALMELLYAQVHRDPPPPSSRQPRLGPYIDAVIMRGLAKDPSARWESCTGFVEALTAAMNGTAAGSTPSQGLTKTIVMVPLAVATAVPGAAPAPPAAPAAVRARNGPEPVAAGPSVAPAAGPAQRQKSRRRSLTMIAGGLIAALVLLAIAAELIVRGTPTISVSPDTVHPGEDAVVTASHLPASQAGEIQMYSVVRNFPFRADKGGRASIDITVPRDIGLGDHLLKLCYNGACHAQTTLHVAARLALASPTPVGNPTSQPPATPRPTANPTAAGTPRPTSSATPNPASTPTPNPCPASSYSAYLTESPGTVVAGVTTVSVAGQNFTPDQGVTVVYSVRNALGQTSIKGSWTRTAACNGSFSVSFRPAVGDIGTGIVSARDAANRSASVSFSIA